MKKYNILLLTNADSDNTGDQIMEACDISLIETVLENLGMTKEEYELHAKGAAAFTKRYFKTKNEKDLKKAHDTLKETDLVIYGGAPIFNYTFQHFYERTALFVDLCQKYNVPVLMSSIGIEYFDESNKKCQRIMESVNQDVVKMITTRDDFDSLKKIKKREDIRIAKVADPAIFSKEVFGGKKKSSDSTQKKIGIFVIRGAAFSDHGYKMSTKQLAKFYKELAVELKARGYEYEFITNGHYGDEAFLDRLLRDYNLSKQRVVFNVFSPEDIVDHMKDYDAIVSARLHPSIVAYAYGIPALGLKWNMKVEEFYKSIHYPNRVVTAEEMSGKYVVDRLGEILKEGVDTDETYKMSVYKTLFESMQEIFGKTDVSCYGYEEVCQKIHPYPGTSPEERELKIRRKFRRLYENYNKYYDVIEKLKPLKWIYDKFAEV